MEEAFAVLGRTGECFWEAELHRLKGEFWLAGPGPSAVQEVEQSLLKALEIARSQGARLLALRAAVSHGRLWCRLGRHAEARLVVTEARKDNEEPSLPDIIEADSLLAESKRGDRLHIPRDRPVKLADQNAGQKIPSPCLASNACNAKSLTALISTDFSPEMVDVAAAAAPSSGSGTWTIG